MSNYFLDSCSVISIVKDLGIITNCLEGYVLKRYQLRPRGVLSQKIAHAGGTEKRYASCVGSFLITEIRSKLFTISTKLPCQSELILRSDPCVRE